MRILYISSKKRWGGVASWMLKTARGLQQRGHTVWVLSHPDSKITSEFPKDLNLVKHKLGFEYNPFAVNYIKKFIKKNKVDLLVTNLEKEVAIGGLAARLGRIPNIRRIGREDDFNNSFKNKWNHQILVDGNIVPCNALKYGAKARASWLNIDNFKTIYNGRNPLIFDRQEIDKQRKEWGIKENQLVIGTTVQLLKVKQVDKLIEAFSALQKEFENIRLVVCGVGKQLENLKKLAVDLSVTKEVIFAGFTDKPALAAKAYDIAVLNSALEGFPNTVVEYFSVGSAVIASDVGGVSEIIENGQNGFMINAHDITDLMEKLKILISDAGLRNKFSENSLKTLTEKFTETKMIDDLEAYFSDQIKKYVKLR
ncbi:MAG: glycosyltransferase family 4 protein [Calditrichae bacterium]|nr:glycosyltransferase family 4 protein [Calditrichota bacterium]MCB9057397.1 glycosyltransferase family 4 protein [Calditrichia bacterium]